MNLKSHQPPQGYLSTKDAAAFLGISNRWLELLRQIGGGPEYLKLGHHKVTYAIHDLVIWAERSRRRNTSEAGLSSSSEVE